MAFPLTAPLLDFLALSVITESDAYGYQITQIVKRAAPMKDSALYPVLKRLQELSLIHISEPTRLQEHGFVETYDQQYQGRNRKYYRITEAGRVRQNELLKEWNEYKFIIDDIVRGGISDDKN